MAIEAELTRRKPDGSTVPWLVNPDGTEPVADQGVRDRLDALIELMQGVSAPTKFLHLQSDAAAVWEFDHNLGFVPSVTVINSAGQQVEGDVQHLSLNRVRITFMAPFSGSASLT